MVGSQILDWDLKCTLERNALAYLKGALLGPAPASLGNIRLGLARTNTLAYLSGAPATKEKKFYKIVFWSLHAVRFFD